MAKPGLEGTGASIPSCRQGPGPWKQPLQEQGQRG
jgi:hypothetical protein